MFHLGSHAVIWYKVGRIVDRFLHAFLSCFSSDYLLYFLHVLLMGCCSDWVSECCRFADEIIMIILSLYF